MSISINTILIVTGPGSFNILNLYDFLTDVVPGTTISITVYILFQNVLPDTSSLDALIIVFIGYIFGHVLRYFRNLNRGGSGIINKLLSPETAIEQSVSDKLSGQFCIGDSSNNQVSDDNIHSDIKNLELISLILSRLENSPFNRALQIEAIYSFYRSMFVASLFLVALSIFTYIFHNFVDSSVFNLNMIILVGLLGVITAVIFKSRKSRYRTYFSTYVIAELYLIFINEEK